MGKNSELRVSVKIPVLAKDPRPTMSTPPEWSLPLHLHFNLKTAPTHSFKFHRHFLLHSDWLRFPTSETDRIAEVYRHPQTNPSLSPETTIRKGVTHHSGIQKNAPLSLLELMSDPHQCKCCLVTPYIRKYPTSRSIAMEETLLEPGYHAQRHRELGRPAPNTLPKTSSLEMKKQENIY